MEERSLRWHSDIFFIQILLAVFSLNIAYAQTAWHNIVSQFLSVSIRLSTFFATTAASSFHACVVF